MKRTFMDIGTTLSAALAVGAYAATHESWNVWLIGDSRRWATGAILALGALTFAFGRNTSGAAIRVIAVLAAAGVVLAIVAFATASLTALSLVVLAVVLIGATSLVGQAAGGHRPVAT